MIKGILIGVLDKGFMYKNFEDNNLYYFNFFDYSINQLFKDFIGNNDLIFSDKNSSLFLIKKNDQIIIRNLNDFFP